MKSCTREGKIVPVNDPISTERMAAMLSSFRGIMLKSPKRNPGMGKSIYQSATKFLKICRKHQHLMSTIQKSWLANSVVINHKKTPKFDCGDCSDCCSDIWRSGENCYFLSEGKCSVYYNRPQFCRVFVCIEKMREMTDEQKEVMLSGLSGDIRKIEIKLMSASERSLEEMKRDGLEGKK